MKNLKRKIGLVLKKLFVLLVVFVLLFSLPFLGLGVNENLDLIYSVFVGAKSKYQGVIEVWNIDTFEAGIVSKSSLLTQAANIFQKKNKGLYVLVRNITENECVNMLADGQVPDLFSCSYGVANKIKDNITAFDDFDYKVSDNFLKAGKVDDGKLFAVAWCSGLYYLISTNNNLKKAGVDVENKVNLLEMALSLGYEVSSKKGVKNIYSLSFGTRPYLVPLCAISEYNESVKINHSTLSFDNEKVNGSSYSAYCRFVAGESVMLLGTQRDMFRMKNREQQGKVSDVVYQPLEKFTDLVQFMFISKGTDEIKNKYKNLFVQFLTEKQFQKQVSKSGLLSVLKQQDFDEISGVMQDITPQIIESYKLNNVFLSENEIKGLHNKILS